MQYTDRLEDIRLLKIEIANIRSQKYLLTRGLCNVIDMRQEVLQLGRDLTQERVRSRALEEEMSTPMNIHRWHQLSGRDPEKMDLIFKVQTLQKYLYINIFIFTFHKCRFYMMVHFKFSRRVLFQTTIAVQKENALRQSNMLYNALKSATANIDNSIRVKQRLNHTRRELATKTLQLKAISAEATVRDQEVHDRDMHLENLKQDLFDKKHELLKEKKEKRKLQIQLDAIKSQLLDNETSPNVTDRIFRTAGAGFRISYGEKVLD